MRKLPFIAMAVLVAAGCSHRSGDGSEPGPGPEGEELTAEEEWVESTGPNGGRPWAQPVGIYKEVFNDSNYLQYREAERLGIDPIHTLADAYNTRRPLVKIENGANYQIDDLTHSMPYLVPEAAVLLDEIGEEFGALLSRRGGDADGNKIIVTSVLRSPYSVKKLRRVNRNAVDSSTHMFGTTFDISWSHFHSPDSSKAVDSSVLKGILAEVLLKKREEGKCLVKYERKTPCFHVTVRHQ